MTSISLTSAYIYSTNTQSKTYFDGLGVPTYYLNVIAGFNTDQGTSTDISGTTYQYTYNSGGIYYYVGSGITAVGGFSGKSSLVSVNIASDVTSISNEAFRNCTGLASITIGSGVTSIGDYAFYGCTSLSSFTISNYVTYLGYYAFYGCTTIASITIGSSVTYIRDYAFYGCTNLTSITIPYNVTTIGKYAFYNCSKLSVTKFLLV